MKSPEENAGDELTLDPADWESMRALGHRMVDDMLDYLRTVRERPVWQPISASSKASFETPAPEQPADPGAVYEEFQRHILPYPLGNIHPRFWGWVIGTGTPLGALSEMLAATMNPNVGGGEHSANYVELQVLQWCKEMLGFPAQASGLLVSGGSMANLVGLTVARNARAEVDVARFGLQAAPRRMLLYGSNETHNSVRKAAGLLGLGAQAWREIAVDSSYCIDMSALRETLVADRAAGHYPFCVVGNAGTVNTGAIDDLAALADLCADEGLWLHVDGAFGAIAALAPRLRPRVHGMERADSLAFDLHKWMYMPYEVGCVLVRHAEEHRNAFLVPTSYLTHSERGAAAGPVWLSEYGMQLSRGFRALKVWMSLKEHGTQKYGALVQQNVDQAEFLGRLVEASPDLELMAPISLNVVCFRYVGRSPSLRADMNSGSDTEANGRRLDRLNEELLLELHESGVAVPTSTRLQGHLALRVAITNHRSRRSDFELLVREVRERGRRLAARAHPRAQ